MKNIQNWIFNKIHTNTLIYNTCWEDPRCDRKLLQLDKNSKIVMISSAGDNAFDYLLDQPAEIHAVDMNFRQNALVELKRSIIKNADHTVLSNFFEKGFSLNAQWIYKQNLRDNLPNYAQKYWDKQIRYFNGKGIRKSFYYRGTSGALAFVIAKYLRLKKKINYHTEALMNADSLQEQLNYYTALEKKLFSPTINLLLNSNYTMYLAGVPIAQQALIQESTPEGNVGYIKTCFRNVFTGLEIDDNYFYQVYYRGHYTEDCCPEYLKKSNFLMLKQAEQKLTTYTSTISQFLIDNPGSYSHFVLLDHQDWLAAHDIPALEEEWQLILKNSHSGTRILMRSAASQIDFFPSFIKERVVFEEALTKQIHQEDRVGTYASVYLGIVK